MIEMRSPKENAHPGFRVNQSTKDAQLRDWKKTNSAPSEPLPVLESISTEENQRKFDELRVDDPEFIHDTSLLTQLKVLLDPASTAPLAEKLEVQQKLNAAYEKYRAKQTNGLIGTLPVVEEKTPSPRKEEKPPQLPKEPLTSPEELQRKIKSYKEHLTPDQLTKEEKAGLFRDLASPVEATRRHAENHLDKKLKQFEFKKILNARTHYDTLGITRDATPQDIKRAYRELAKKYHSDITTGSSDYIRRQSEESIRKINEAYTVLSDPQSRTTYDLGVASPRRAEASRPSQAGWGSPLNDIFRDIFEGNGFGMGGFQTPGFDTSGFNRAGFSPSPSERTASSESPQQKADAQKRQQETQVRSLESEIRGARSIHQIITSLEKLSKLNYVFNFKDYTLGTGYEKKQVAPQEIITQINTAVKNMRAPESTFLESINAITDQLNIRLHVRVELETRKKALDTLGRIDVGEWDIRSALANLARMAEEVTATVDGKPIVIVLATQIAAIREVTGVGIKPEAVNALITKVTPWKDLDLKIYYAVREKSYNQKTWQSVPIPPSIAQRYEQYRQKRAGI